MESIYLEGIDYNIFSGKLNSDAVDLDFNNSLLQKFIYSKTNFKWEVESLDLKQYCLSAKKTDEKKPLAVLPNREAALNNSTNVNTNVNNNNYGEDYYSNITEEIANIDQNYKNANSNNNNYNKVISNIYKRNVVNILTDNGTKIALFENASEKNFENQPVIEKKNNKNNNINNKIVDIKEIVLSNKPGNVTIFSINASEDKANKLDSLNEFKFKEKMNKLKLDSKKKVDFSSKKIIINKHIKKLNLDLNLSSNNSITNSTFLIENINDKTNANNTCQESVNKNNIKEEEIKIKQTKPVESIKLIKYDIDINNKNKTKENNFNNFTENIDKVEKKVELFGKKLNKLSSEINLHLQIQQNLTNSSALPFSTNSTVTYKKDKSNGKKNSMLNHLISLHKFRI